MNNKLSKDKRKQNYILVFIEHNSYLTNYGQKKSINNIQDLGLSADSRQCIGIHRQYKWCPLQQDHYSRQF
jgi:hypothetical protein